MTISCWHVVKGHRGDLVAVEKPEPGAEIVCKGLPSKNTALAYIAERKREQQISRGILLAVIVAAVFGIAGVAA